PSRISTRRAADQLDEDRENGLHCRAFQKREESRPGWRQPTRNAVQRQTKLRSGIKVCAATLYSRSTNVTFILTRYSVILPSSTTTFCSWTQAPFTLSSVLSA